MYRDIRQLSGVGFSVGCFALQYVRFLTQKIGYAIELKIGYLWTPNHTPNHASAGREFLRYPHRRWVFRGDKQLEKK